MKAPMPKIVREILNNTTTPGIEEIKRKLVSNKKNITFQYKGNCYRIETIKSIKDLKNN